MSETQRITFIHQHFRVPSEGGGSRGWEFARRLAANGHEVSVICGGSPEMRWEEAGVRIIRLPVAYRNSMSNLQRARAFLKFMLAATWMALRIPADTIFATSTPLTVAVPAMISSRIKRARFVFEVRDLWPSVPARLGYLKSRTLLKIAQLVERLAYQRATSVIALSPGMAEGILQTAPLSRVTVIPNACDFDIFDKPKSQRDESRRRLGWTKPTVVYAGSFGDIYHVRWLGEIAVRNPEFTFHYMGDGRGVALVRTLLEEANIIPEDILAGAVPKLEVADRVAAADLCLSSVLDEPALHAASINKVFDAMAAGRPIVFNHGGWLAELCVEHGAGWILPSEDYEKAGRMVAELLKNPELLLAAGDRARELGRRFDRDRLFEQFQDVIGGSAQESGRHK
ncbi:glycosyltransferase family 4 protein [Propionibacteriaceae bacterium Y1923]